MPEQEDTRMDEPERTRPIRTLLDRAEADDPGQVTYVEQRPARTGVARLLDVAEGAPLVLRQRVALQDGVPAEFVSLWLDPEIARATGLDTQTPVTTSVRELIESATGRRFGRVAAHLTARRPTSAEVKTLGLARNMPVLGVLATVTDTQGRPVLVVDLALPGELYELTDAYPL
ncbi:UTRA domain-containing protein [Actinoallomurus spadix]|nr:UTRA domain-containing protein [Actinoallomurus spadix]MCO5987891.1 UTRA domain-containing protein [Actinoallomurus spadix]